MTKPLVTVICICYNHAEYVYEALCSVRKQSYEAIQLIIADDASTDKSILEIQRFLLTYPELNAVKVFNRENTGNCKLFNKALTLAEGKYIIDLSADDYLYTSCIEEQVNLFEAQEDHVGVVFTNVDLVNNKGELQKTQYAINEYGRSIEAVPQGDVYAELIKRYFISPVGMMMRRKVLEDLGGYDETLAYEDFDFWIRSSRYCEYRYLDKCLVAKRILPISHSSKFLSKGNEAMFISTARICQKLAWLNKIKNKEEDSALLRRIRYEIKQTIKYEVKSAFDIYILLLKNRGCTFWEIKFYKILFQLNSYFKFL